MQLGVTSIVVAAVLFIFINPYFIGLPALQLKISIFLPILVDIMGLLSRIERSVGFTIRRSFEPFQRLNLNERLSLICTFLC